MKTHHKQLFGSIGAGLTFFLLWALLSLASLVVTCLVIYFFLAAGGVVPPLDFIPFVPYV